MADKINFNAIKKGMEAAQSDTTPFLIPGDEPTVVGDANKTQINAHDFEITFRIPQKMEDGSIKQVKQKKEYKGVYITPRMDSVVQRLVTQMMPYMYEIGQDGNLRPYTPEEFEKVSKDFDQELTDIMYETVGTVLRIDKMLWDFMMPDSVEAAVMKLIIQIPELINEADSFFASSSSTR